MHFFRHADQQEPTLRKILPLLLSTLFLCCGTESVNVTSTQPAPTTTAQQRSGLAPELTDEPIPIFLITCDRLTATQQTIASFYREIHHPIEIVIHDNASSYPPFLAYLDELEAQGVHVVRNERRAAHAEMLNGVRATVNAWYREHDAPYYVVTDPDIELESGPGDIMQFYAHLLQKHPRAQVVGPMLRIDDIPDTYPLKKEVIRRHTDQFWHKRPTPVPWKDAETTLQQAPIDTTFGMYRKGYAFRRLSQGFRTYAPYQARHLDWYLDPDSLTEDQRYYMEHASDVSHWGGVWLRRKLGTKR